MGDPTEVLLDELAVLAAEDELLVVVGPEIHRGPTGASLEEVLAPELAMDLPGLSSGEGPRPKSFREVMRRYRNVEGAGDVHPVVCSLWRRLSLEPPAIVRRLAEISPLRLFLTTNVDPLLARALDLVRHGGERRTVRRTHRMRMRHLEKHDLPGEWKKSPLPIVFHLFGAVEEGLDFVFTEEEAMECLLMLQQRQADLPILFDALRDHSILFLGCSFPDWFARFFIRIVRSERLMLHPQGRKYFVVGDSIGRTEELSGFLREHHVQVLKDVDCAGVVEAIAARVRGLGANCASMAEEFVFLSYAREDEARARMVKETLAAAGIPVWMDRERLLGGDWWRQEIEDRIARCALFIPLVTARTRERPEGYVFQEWRLAEGRVSNIRDPVSVKFIRPIAFDGVDPDSAALPKDLWTHPKTHWQSADDGGLDPAFVDGVRAGMSWQAASVRGSPRS